MVVEGVVGSGLRVVGFLLLKNLMVIFGGFCFVHLLGVSETRSKKEKKLSQQCMSKPKQFSRRYHRNPKFNRNDIQEAECSTPRTDAYK